jgi:hypothetical protein
MAAAAEAASRAALTRWEASVATAPTRQELFGVGVAAAPAALASGFDFTGTLPTGTYDLVVFARSARTQTVTNYRIVRINVQ